MHSAKTYLTTLAAGVLCLLAAPAPAGEIFVYQAADGSRLITDHPRIEAGYRLVKVYAESDVWQQTGKRRGTAAAFKPQPSSYDGLIESTARQLRLDPMLIKSVMQAESAFDPNAVSRKGASGLMQLMPATARRYGVSNLFDPRQNVMGGARYLSFLLERFDGDLELALAGYNAGENAVDNHRGVPPYEETRHYVKKVLRLYRQYRNEHCGTQLRGSGDFHGRVISCSASSSEASVSSPRLGKMSLDVSSSAGSSAGETALLGAEDSQNGWRHLD
ncbi:MAG TPA: lytic transglycosylase domain-containing protein [Arenicellales bacterium]|nr:lytic transglycosylase domain-containing protein [Arenicellales bacterium]